MKQILGFLIAVLLVAVAFNARSTNTGADTFGADLPPNVKKPSDIFNAVDMALFMCSMSFSQSRNLAELQSRGHQSDPAQTSGADYRRCITLHKERIKTIHKGIASKVKGASAKRALKEYVVLAGITLDGIDPLANELVIDYERRKNSERRELEKQKARLEAELD